MVKEGGFRVLTSPGDEGVPHLAGVRLQRAAAEGRAALMKGLMVSSKESRWLAAACRKHMCVLSRALQKACLSAPAASKLEKELSLSGAHLTSQDALDHTTKKNHLEICPCRIGTAFL